MTLSNRLCYHVDELKGSDEPDIAEVRDPCGLDEANLVGSLCTDGKHRAVLDIDFPAMLVPSSTPGHFHLYLELPMETETYLRFVDMLAEFGVVSKFYAKVGRMRSQTFCRLPWVRKEQKSA
jgi:hypothetical protein